MSWSKWYSYQITASFGQHFLLIRVTYVKRGIIQLLCCLSSSHFFVRRYLSSRYRTFSSFTTFKQILRKVSTIFLFSQVLMNTIVMIRIITIIFHPNLISIAIHCFYMNSLERVCPHIKILITIFSTSSVANEIWKRLRGAKSSQTQKNEQPEIGNISFHTISI